MNMILQYTWKIDLPLASWLRFLVGPLGCVLRASAALFGARFPENKPST